MLLLEIGNLAKPMGGRIIFNLVPHRNCFAPFSHVGNFKNHLEMQMVNNNMVLISCEIHDILAALTCSFTMKTSILPSHFWFTSYLKVGFAPPK